ncbi:cell division protein CrgA [Aeromicrobium alkaliterrae]|uniref:Cell division protein CrgA n=1 Tax=Aeromicrobium alkaliterrae TaxID=302168 RepID=A0ABN2JDL2_9ACTN
MSKSPSNSRIRGGWWHPAAIVLALAGLGWAAMWLFWKIDTNLPGPEVPKAITDLGNWNWAIAGVLVVVASFVASGTAPEPEPGATLGWRYAPQLMVGSAVIGLLWIVTFYTTSNTDVNLPVFTDLGNWNLVVGMGFIVAAFGFATKWE